MGGSMLTAMEKISTYGTRNLLQHGSWNLHRRAKAMEPAQLPNSPLASAPRTPNSKPLVFPMPSPMNSSKPTNSLLGLS